MSVGGREIVVRHQFERALNFPLTTFVDAWMMAMSMSTPSLSRADLDTTLARVTAKPNVLGALVLARETGAIIRSTLADDDLAKKYSLGVKRTTEPPMQEADG
jgi:hypothetical protein